MFKSNLEKAIASVAFASVAFTSSPAHAIIDLGFAIDRSGSLGQTAYEDLITDGLADALLEIPSTSEYRVTVVSFGQTATLIGSGPVLFDGTQAAFIDTVRNDLYNFGDAGATNISGAVDLLSSEVSGVGFGTSSLINIGTDGAPTAGNTNGASVQASAIAAGWDGISAEAIGVFSTTFLEDLVYPTPIVTTTDPDSLPDPFANGFIFRVDAPEDYPDAIVAKVEEIVVDTPEPGSLLGLLAVGGLTLAAKRKKQS